MPGRLSVMPGWRSVMPGLTGHLYHNVDIRIGPAQKAVSHITTYHKGPYAQFPGRLPHQLEHRMV